MGFQRVPNLVPYINLSLNRHRSVLVDQIPLQLDWEGVKRKRRWRERGDNYLRERLFQIFPSNEGDYSRDGYYSRDCYYSRKYTSHTSQQTTNNYQPTIDYKMSWDTSPKRRLFYVLWTSKGGNIAFLPHPLRTMLGPCSSYLQKTTNTPTLNGGDRGGVRILSPYLSTMSQQFCRGLSESQRWPYVL